MNSENNSESEPKNIKDVDFNDSDDISSSSVEVDDDDYFSFNSEFENEDDKEDDTSVDSELENVATKTSKRIIPLFRKDFYF